MELVYKAIRWEDADGWVELRFKESGRGPHVTGHWKAWGDSDRHHNTTDIVDNEGQLDEGQIGQLCFYAIGRDEDKKLALRRLILESIEKEYDTSAFKKEKITHE